MRQVIHQAPIYEHVLESYEAETYVKGRTHVPRKNKLLRYAYLVFPIERHPRDAFFEMSGPLRRSQPLSQRDCSHQQQPSRRRKALQGDSLVRQLERLLPHDLQ